MNQGLSDNYIDDVCKDSQGFLWVATGGGGIVRYDGYEFINFNTTSERARLKSNFVRKACEDNFDRLWVISEAGVDVLSLSSFKIVEPKNGGELFELLLNSPAIDIIKDSNGDLWLCSGGTIYKVTFDEKGDIARIYSFPDTKQNIQVIGMKDVDSDGDIWAGFGNNIYKLHASGAGELSYSYPMPELHLESSFLLHTFMVKDNEVWIGTNNGLIRYNRNENVSKLYRHDIHNPFSLSQDYVTDLAITADKQLLVSTLMGFNVYNPINDHFERIRQVGNTSLNNNKGLNSNFVNCIFADGEVIWVGTETGGINKFTPKTLVFRNYVNNKDDAGSLSPNPVNAIYMDQEETLWVGTVEGGLNKKKKGTEGFTHFTTPLLSHNSVSALTSDNNDNLWIGTWGNGITVLNRHQPYKNSAKFISMDNYPSFTSDFVGALIFDSLNNGIWIGANPGVFFYDISRDELSTPLSHDQSVSVLGSIGSLIDSKNRLWLGTMDGVYIVDLTSKSGNLFSYKYLKYKLNDPESHLIEKPTCFYESSDSTIWIGSNGHGIYKYIEQGEKNYFVCYTVEDGLVNNNVRGILEDDSGRVWISTNNGLSCFNPEKELFTNYTTEDGLASNQFYWNAYCRAENGLLYFGCLEGLVAIDPKQLEKRRGASNVVITNLKIMNEDVYPDGKHIDIAISKAKTLHLHEREKSFSLEFSALNYNQQTAAMYMYRLLGFDDKWIEVPASRRFVSYTNLPSGRYTFQVKYVPNTAVEQLPITELTIVVRPFFFKQLWFIVILVLLLIGLVLFVYKKRVTALERQKDLLHKTVVERTKELEEQNEMLVRQNEKITQQKEELIEMSQKVKELTTDKLTFFTNITHEFRTPITLIIGPVEKALKLSHDPQVIKQLSFVDRNSKYLLSLINQLMDFRKVESGNLTIQRTRNDFIAFIDSIILSFAAFAEDRRIDIRKYYRLSSPIVFFDSNAMQKVVNNLLSNAIKFTPEGGIISVYVTKVFNKSKACDELFICIKDTGNGVDEEDLSKIFNRFYQSSNSRSVLSMGGQSGTGIGLYLAKQIVQLHGGDIIARNNKVKGISFYIGFPIEFETEEDSLTVEETDMFDALELSESPDFMPPHFSPNRLTILVVEDNKDMRAFICSILSDHYNVLDAEDGMQALSLLNTCNVDFIISDLMMPVMDGIEFSQKVKENLAISHIPILMLTAKTSPEARIESYRVGVDAYLMKPFNEELLLTRIHNILENRNRYQQQFALQMDVNTLNIEEDSRDKKFLNKVFNVVEENYKNASYDVTDFVNDMAISKSLLNKKMQNLTGQSIGQFIRNYRLNIGRELIEKNRVTRNMNISQIAYEVGFNDPKYFTRCFTKRYNIPPSAFLEKKDE